MLRELPFLVWCKQLLVILKRYFPCSTLLEGEYGLHDLCIGVPVVLGENGIESIVEINLSAAEKAHLQESAIGVSKTNRLLRIIV